MDTRALLFASFSEFLARATDFLDFSFCCDRLRDSYYFIYLQNDWYYSSAAFAYCSGASRASFISYYWALICFIFCWRRPYDLIWFGPKLSHYHCFFSDRFCLYHTLLAFQLRNFKCLFICELFCVFRDPHLLLLVRDRHPGYHSCMDYWDQYLSLWQMLFEEYSWPWTPIQIELCYHRA